MFSLFKLNYSLFTVLEKDEDLFKIGILLFIRVNEEERALFIDKISDYHIIFKNSRDIAK